MRASRLSQHGWSLKYETFFFIFSCPSYFLRNYFVHIFTMPFCPLLYSAADAEECWLLFLILLADSDPNAIKNENSRFSFSRFLWRYRNSARAIKGIALMNLIFFNFYTLFLNYTLFTTVSCAPSKSGECTTCKTWNKSCYQNAEVREFPMLLVKLPEKRE